MSCEISADYVCDGTGKSEIVIGLYLFFVISMANTN